MVAAEASSEEAVVTAEASSEEAVVTAEASSEQSTPAATQESGKQRFILQTITLKLESATRFELKPPKKRSLLTPTLTTVIHYLEIFN